MVAHSKIGWPHVTGPPQSWFMSCNFWKLVQAIGKHTFYLRTPCDYQNNEFGHPHGLDSQGSTVFDWFTAKKSFNLMIQPLVLLWNGSVKWANLECDIKVTKVKYKCDTGLIILLWDRIFWINLFNVFVKECNSSRLCKVHIQIEVNSLTLW